MPFADYQDFDDCLSKNSDKSNPSAYCGSIKHKVEDTVSETDFSKGFDIMEPAIQEQTQGKKRAFTHSSSWVGNVRYNPQNQTMRVMMNGKGYGFCGVPERVFDAWEGTASKGEYWWRNIKDRYNCSSLSETTSTDEFSPAEVRESLYVNLAKETVRTALQREEQLRAMGIPESEIFRTISSELQTSDQIEQWPPKIENRDSLPTPDVLQIPNTIYPPYVAPESLLFDGDSFGITTELAIPSSLSNVSIGGKKKKDIVEGPDDLFPEDISAAQSLGSKTGANPSIHGLEGWASYRKIPEFSRNYEEPRGPNILTETRKRIRETLQNEFTWMSPEYIEKAKTIPQQLGGNGRVILIRAAGETITDHRAEAPPGTPESMYLRKLTAKELMKMARTGYQKGSDINHLGTNFQTPGMVFDADFDDVNNFMQFLHYETDPEILAAIENGTIPAVSINGGAPRRQSVQCDDSGCFIVPEGVILGENDGIAFTYVVTNPNGMMWRGQHIPPAKPGIGFTQIEFLT